MTERIDTEVAILGGGIVGGSAALFLRRLGVPVVLLEAALCGARASGVNYGGVRRQGRGLEQMPLARRAHELWGQLPQLIGIDGEYVRSGHLKLACSDADLDALHAYRAQTRGFGMNLEMLDRAALARRFGWLGAHVVGGSFCPEDGHANPRLVSPGFGRAARALGADVRESTRVTEAVHDGDRFILRAGDALEVRSRFLLNCAGAWAGRFAQDFGETVPETSIHPLMMVTEPLPLFMDVSLGMQGGRHLCAPGGARQLRHRRRPRRVRRPRLRPSRPRGAGLADGQRRAPAAAVARGAGHPLLDRGRGQHARPQPGAGPQRHRAGSVPCFRPVRRGLPDRPRRGRSAFRTGR